MGVADTSRPNLVRVLRVPLDGHLRLVNVKKRPLETFEVSDVLKLKLKLLHLKYNYIPNCLYRFLDGKKTGHF